MLKRIIAIMLMGVMISCMLAGCGVVSTKNNQTEKSINTDNISNGAAKTAQKDTSDKKIFLFQRMLQQKELMQMREQV